MPQLYVASDELSPSRLGIDTELLTNLDSRQPGAVQLGRLDDLSFTQLAAMRSTFDAVALEVRQHGRAMNAVGFAQPSRYDSRNRVIEKTGSDGLSTTFAWDSLDRVIATTDPVRIRTTTAYDHGSRPIATYGPAPARKRGAKPPPPAATIDGTAR